MTLVISIFHRKLYVASCRLVKNFLRSISMLVNQLQLSGFSPTLLELTWRKSPKHIASQIPMSRFSHLKNIIFLKVEQFSRRAVQSIYCSRLIISNFPIHVAWFSVPRAIHPRRPPSSTAPWFNSGWDRTEVRRGYWTNFVISGRLHFVERRKGHHLRRVYSRLRCPESRGKSPRIIIRRKSTKVRLEQYIITTRSKKWIWTWSCPPRSGAPQSIASKSSALMRAS